jgi:hypothetical protein
MLFQNIAKPESILRTDFDEFFVSLIELETSSHEYEDVFGPQEGLYVTKNYITATIEVEEPDYELLSEIDSTNTKCCEPRYYLSLETESHIFSKGIIMARNNSEFEIRFIEFRDKGTEN